MMQGQKNIKIQSEYPFWGLKFEVLPSGYEV
jgi:hypothetical protein